MWAVVSPPQVSPLMRTESRRFRPSTSSAVTMHGPSTLDPSQSLALAGPIPIGSSSDWMSRADTPFQTLSPKAAPRSLGLGGARRHAIPDAVAEDVLERMLELDVFAPPPDHDRKLQLMVELLRVRGPRDLLVRADDRVGHALVVGRRPIPLGRDRAAQIRHSVLQMAFEGEEVAQRARPQRRKQDRAGNGGRGSGMRRD